MAINAWFCLLLIDWLLFSLWVKPVKPLSALGNMFIRCFPAPETANPSGPQAELPNFMLFQKVVFIEGSKLSKLSRDFRDSFGPHPGVQEPFESWQTRGEPSSMSS